jgi:hypothetical protein
MQKRNAINSPSKKKKRNGENKPRGCSFLFRKSDKSDKLDVAWRDKCSHDSW